MTDCWYDDVGTAENRARYLIDHGKEDGPLYVYIDGGDGESPAQWLLTDTEPASMPPGAALTSKAQSVRGEPAYVLNVGTVV